MTDLFFLEKNKAAEDEVSRLEPLMRPYRSRRDSWDYRSASALIYKALTRYGIDLSEYREDESGRPFIASGKADFSVSHSGRFTCVAITDEPEKSIGIDIEDRERTQKRDILGISRRFFQEDEAEAVADAADKEREFLRIWTMKEAMMKAGRIPLHQAFKKRADNPVYIESTGYIMCIEIYSRI
ncbi:MAG: 4'-phosphopantetheinyl transferase family protein [Candidatus Weimeria sp.]